MGTPCCEKWDAEWIEQVDRIEQQLGHRICGAHSPAWTPCKLTSTHENGRCRFHGGAIITSRAELFKARGYGCTAKSPLTFSCMNRE